MTNYSTCGNMTTFKMPTVEEMMRVMGEFRRKYPLSELPAAIECPPSTEHALLHACGQMFPEKRHEAFGIKLGGLPIERNMEVPSRAYVIRMADGSRTCYYPTGLAVKCIGESEKSRPNP